MPDTCAADAFSSLAGWILTHRFLRASSTTRGCTPSQLPDLGHLLAGEPVWDVSEGQVSKGFRKLSLCCHPDKSSDPEAPTAFEQLKKAKARLLNELDRDDYVRRRPPPRPGHYPNPNPNPDPDPHPNPGPKPSPGAPHGKQSYRS